MVKQAVPPPKMKGKPPAPPPPPPPRPGTDSLSLERREWGMIVDCLEITANRFRAMAGDDPRLHPVHRNELTGKAEQADALAAKIKQQKGLP